MASRLSLVVLVGWFALIAGGAPAFGCAASTFQGDCCPPDSTVPCPGDAPIPVADDLANACCAAAPAPASAAPPAVARVDSAALTHGGLPDPLTLAAFAAAPTLRDARSLAFKIAPASNAVPIYLHTRRLRL